MLSSGVETLRTQQILPSQNKSFTGIVYRQSRNYIFKKSYKI